MEQFFSVLGDGQRPAHSAPIVVAAVYLGIYMGHFHKKGQITVKTF